MLTPKLKLVACNKAPLCSVQHFFTASNLSYQPVVPTTTGTCASKQRCIFFTANSGRVNSIATSDVFNSSEVKFLFWLLTINEMVCPLSKAICSITFPIFPYPINAMFIYFSFSVSVAPNAGVFCTYKADGCQCKDKSSLTSKLNKCASTAASTICNA